MMFQSCLGIALVWETHSRRKQMKQSLLPQTIMWTFRPSALYDLLYRGSMTMGTLLKIYDEDNARAEKEGVSVPKRQQNDTQIIRTCQWNVHHFFPHGNSSLSPNQVAQAVVRKLLETNADVIVLNEFGELEDFMDDTTAYVTERLQDEGYTVHSAASAFPTVIATNLSVQLEHKFILDQYRAAVALQVKSSGGSAFWVYGTHLEASDCQSGAARTMEMKRLLTELEGLSNDDDDILVIGDFNQQREQDYAPQEWEAICANKFFRHSPQDDGVATQLAEAGFSCIWDDSSPKINCNWPHLDSKPPATHWSGTIVDYTYYRGPTLVPSGVFVSPCGVSDHRLVVCDWKGFTKKAVEPLSQRKKLFERPWKKKK